MTSFGGGSCIFIVCSNSSPCPLSVVEKFLMLGEHSSTSRLFVVLRTPEREVELRKKPMLDSRVNKLIKQERLRDGLD